jgi:serine/threonine-protein kinase
MTTTTNPMNPTVTAEINVGRYVLYRRIASGGMATVYLGRLRGPVGFSRMVAVKRLLPRFARDPDFVTMFLDEARLAAGLRHPNIVPTLDVVATKGEVFLVMEYVQGESLAQLLRAADRHHERMPQRIAVSIVSGVLLGLHAAHEARDSHGVPLNLVHRDVSPHNVIVGIDGTARVLDFGVAKANGRAQHLTREGHIKGKLGYMAPEQLAGDLVTRQSDVYSAAVVLWESLTGRKLYEGSNQDIAITRARPTRIEPPSLFRPGVTAEMDAVVLKGLAYDRADRYSTAREMAAALERIEGAVSVLEVAEWVEVVAGQQIHLRAQQFQTFEQSTASRLPEPPDLQTAETAPAPPSGTTDDTTTPDRKDPLASLVRDGAFAAHASPERTSVSTPYVHGFASSYVGRRRFVAGIAGFVGLALLLGAGTVASLRGFARRDAAKSGLVSLTASPPPALALPPREGPVEPISQASPIDIPDPVPVTSLPSAAGAVAPAAAATKTTATPRRSAAPRSRPPAPKAPPPAKAVLSPYDAIGGRQ